MKQETADTMSPREAAAKWNLTVRRVRQLCAAGEIPCERIATPYGPMYRIPRDAERRTA